MNPVLQEGVRSIQLGWIAGVMTIVFIAFFVGWTYWAFAPANRDRLDVAARLPLTNGDDFNEEQQTA
jgi:cbb3-type cytochrome oxidase subunit 3